MKTLFFFSISACPNLGISFDGAWRSVHSRRGGFLPGACRFGLQIRCRRQTVEAAHTYGYLKCYTNKPIKPIFSLTGLQLPKSSGGL
jgi:hypothetical protein